MTSIELRPLRADDVSEKYVAWFSDPHVIEFLSMRFRSVPISHVETVEFVRSCESAKRYHWGIFIEDRHVGNVSTSAWSLDNHWIDISFLIGDRSCWGRGIGRRAVAGAIEYLFSTQRFHKIVAGAAELNQGSISLLAGLGFKEEGRLRKQAFFPRTQSYQDDVRFGLFLDEWRRSEVRRQMLVGVEVKPMFWEGC